jgi:hypothetical protein
MAKTTTTPGKPASGPSAASGAAGPAGGSTALARPAAGPGPGGQLARVSDIPWAMMDLQRQGGGDIKLAMRENIGDSVLGAFDFSRVKVPAGGGMAWTIINQETGEPDAAKEFEGIIVAWRDQKAFWRSSLTSNNVSNTPPDCYSLDTVQGIGDPGTLCAQCKYNLFGSARGEMPETQRGRGKACKDTRMIFFMRSGSVLPELLIIPPSSLKSAKAYFIQLMSRSVPFWRAITRFRLSPDRNPEGNPYSRVEMSCAAVLDGQAMAAARGYSETIRKMLGVAVVLPQLSELEGNDDTTAGGGETYEGHIAETNAAVAASAANGDDWTKDTEGGPA